MRIYDLKIGEHWISDALSTVSILSSFLVPLNFSNYHWIASINKASTEYISPRLFFSFFYISISFFSLFFLFHYFLSILFSFPCFFFFFFYLSFCRLVCHISAKRVRRNGNIESAGKANKAGISRSLDYLCSEPLYYNLSTIHGTMICLTSYEPSEAFGFPISELEYAVDRWFKFKRFFRKSILSRDSYLVERTYFFFFFFFLHFFIAVYPRYIKSINERTSRFSIILIDIDILVS